MKAFVIVETVIRIRERVIIEIPEEVAEQYDELMERGLEQRAKDVVSDEVLTNHYDEAVAKAPSYHHADAEESGINAVQPWRDE